jgi:ATP-dependent DNA helicase RecQ
MMNVDTYSALKKYFGFTSFREGQESVIKAILAGRDTLAVMPTGAGKSLCYELPALLLPLGTLTVVFSPLISLMRDQVAALCDAGISAAYLNATLSPTERALVRKRAQSGDIRLLYVAPERLGYGFGDVLAGISVALVVVDEAHCVSQWGHDFRPAYRAISGFIASLPTRPVVAAFTATATKTVRDDICNVLDLRDPFIQISSFDRPNLHFEVINIRRNEKPATLLKLLHSHANQSGIIYCATRKTVDNVALTLKKAGFSAAPYHAGLTHDERTRNQDDFIYDRIPIIVATNAFGMGIDKSNVSFVIHYQMPANIESYYQEAGRAGRDGTPACCTLLYSQSDIRTNKYLITHTVDEFGEINPEQTSLRLRLLNDMVDYAESTECLRTKLLAYFGEDYEGDCDNCSACDEEKEDIDITIDAQKILSCVYRVCARGNQYGSKLIVSVLRGSHSERIRELGFDTLSTYNIMHGVSAEYINQLISFLVRKRFLLRSDDMYQTLSLSRLSEEALRERRRITMRVHKENLDARGDGDRSSKHVAIDALPEDDYALFEKLRACRTRLAKNADVPAFIVFSDATLRSMCHVKPRTREEFLTVLGVGENKANKYGKEFLAVIADELKSRAVCGEAEATTIERADTPAAGLSPERELFARLHACRAKLAADAGVRDCVIASNTALYEMCHKKPRTQSDILHISGIDERRAADYGAVFLAVIAGEPASTPSARDAATTEPTRSTKPHVLPLHDVVLKDDDHILFERLRACRMRLAQSAGLAAFNVFSDATLRDMCCAKPRTREELLTISGVGERKADKYGDTFLAVIADELESRIRCAKVRATLDERDKTSAVAITSVAAHAVTPSEMPSGGPATVAASDVVAQDDHTLLERLYGCRAGLAAVSGISATAVFSDATLDDICRLKPHTREELIAIPHVSKRKVDKYGAAFLAVITNNANPLSASSVEHSVLHAALELF